MTERISFDHVAVAVPRLADAPPFLVGELGGVPEFGAASEFYTFAQWRFAGGGRLEILEPRGDQGFLHRYLAGHGPGVHHVTFKVPSLAAACLRAEAHGYTIVGRDDSDPGWAEAFLHPKQALGIVVQLAESRPTPGVRPPRWRGPRGPASPPPPVTLLGLRLSAASRERSHTQWSVLLRGQEAEGPEGTLVYRWPGSPMRLTVEIDAVRNEGPLGIELASTRPVSLPPGPHPVLGAVFLRCSPA
jgi:hypothetical protein